MDTKICFRCKETKPVSEYYRSNTRYYQRECIPCTKARRSKWWRTPAGKRSSKNTKLRKYGITLEQYEAKLLAQGGVCKICASPASDSNILRVDHCHATDALRDLLCNGCNLALGNLRDNPFWREAAAQYLRSHGR